GVPFYVVALVGIMALHFATSADLLLPGAVAFGLGQGSEVALTAYYTSRYFGLREYSGILAFFIAGSNAGIACGTILMGSIYDAEGSYRPAYFVLSAAMLIAIACVAALRPYTFAKGHAEENPGAKPTGAL